MKAALIGAGRIIGAMVILVGVIVVSIRGIEDAQDVMNIALGLGYVCTGALIVIAVNSFVPELGQGSKG